MNQQQQRGLSRNSNRLGKASRKKVAVLLDFVQKRGEGPAQFFLSTFHKLYVLGQFVDGEGVGDPCLIFWHTGIQNKWYKLSKLGGGGRSNMDKS